MGAHSNFFMHLDLDLVLGVDADELDRVGTNDRRQIFVDMRAQSMGG